MIGRLLQSAASTFGHPAAPRPPPPLESVTEETHTRELLYPDVHALRAALAPDLALGLPAARPTAARDAANYDDRGALDVNYPADLRVVVAQDAHARHHQPQVLYDSRPARGAAAAPAAGDAEAAPAAGGRPPAASRTNRSVASPTAATAPRHRSTPSGSFSPLSPTSPRSPADKGRFSFQDTRPRPLLYEQSGGDGESTQGKLAREVKEETDALLGCMFGAPGFRLEPGTKLHILPRKVADQEAARRPAGGARPISSGGNFQRKRTPLVRSTSAAEVAVAEGSDGRLPNSKPSIMFTRLFTVHVPERTPVETGEDAAATRSADGAPAADGERVKQKKVPMYAVAVILLLPPENFQRPRPAHSPQGLSPAASSLNESTPANSWRGEQSAFASFMEIRSQGSFDTVLNAHIPYVLQHWHIVNRALELLELCARAKLSVLLEQADIPPQLTPAPSPKPGITKPKKPKPQSQQNVYVLPGCLQADEEIKKIVSKTGQRIIGALRTRRVVVGQGRWGAWREEARWVGRWAGGKEQNFFLFNFLTAFLGTHTEWLELLAPKWYRKRHAVQQRLRDGNRSALVARRTVIVSSDKMAARRLIFLLAAFLPSHLNPHQVTMPSREHSSIFSSESPPQFMPREGGLRRSSTNKSSFGRRSGAEASRHMRSVSFSLAETGHDETVDDAIRSRARRDSDVRSIRNPALAVNTGDTGSRKASMSTVTADTVQAVPHFSHLSSEEPESPVAERRRPGSGESMASLVLSHALKRSESTAGSTSGSGGRWGSVVSGFWSNRRDSSTDDSDVFVSSQESPRKTNFPRHGHEHRVSASGLERMVEEADALRRSPAQPSLLSGSPRRPLQLEECLKPRHPALQESQSAARNIPRPRKPERLPLKLSFNEDEGFLDIAMDAEHSFGSSLASSFASIRPPPGGPLLPSAAAHEHLSSPYGSVAADDAPCAYSRAEPALDVAGWLKVYQPDFILQAVRTYDTLTTDIGDSMQAEAALAPSSVTGSTGWTDVSETLVADTTRFVVERMRLERRSRGTDATGSPAWETRLMTEPLMDLDPILTDAVERILARSGPSSRASSPPRPSGGMAAARPVLTGSGSTPSPDHLGLGPDASGTEPTPPHAECRRTVLGALQEVVRSIAAERSAGKGLPAGSRRGDSDGSLREGVRRWMRDVEAGPS